MIVAFIINCKKSYKWKRSLPKSLLSFVISTTSSAQFNTSEKLEESKEDYFRCHSYFYIRLYNWEYE